MSRKTSAEQPRRVKVTLACIICRKKKVKCNGVQPTCSRCHSMGIQCQYSDPPKKRGPPKGYIEVINNRAHRIESLLGKQKPSSNSPVVSSTVWSPSITTNNGSNCSNGNNSPSTNTLLPQQPNDVLKFITEASKAVQIKWANKHHDDPGSHQNMYTFSPSHNNRKKVNEDNNLNSCDEENTGTSDQEEETMSPELALLWTNNVFEYFNIFFPILSRQHFLFQLIHQKRSMNPLLRYAVYALGCRYNNPEDRTAQLWFEKACSLVDHEINVSLSTVQALAIMCWYTYLTGDFQQCNQLRRQLYSALLDCNLNQETTTNFSVVEQEMRRRGLWTTYVIDQWLSVCTGERVQPPMITSTWNVKLPKLEDSQLYAIDVRNLQPMSMDLQKLSVESALQVAVFSEMVKLVQVVVCSCDGRNAKAALTEWLLHLPPYLEFGKATNDSPPSPIARIFHLLYYTVQVIINRPTEAAISPSTITSYQHFPPQQQQEQKQQQVINHTVDQYGTTAANTIIHIAEQMVQCNQTKYLYNVFGLSLSLAATIHLENARLFDSTFTNNNLTRSMNVVKQTNCTIVPHVDLDRILHRFVDNRCGVVLDHYYHHNTSSLQHQEQQQLRPSLHQIYPFADFVPTSSKRPHLGDELERAVKRPSFDFSRWLPPEQQQYTIPSLSETGNYNNLVDFFITTSPASITSTSDHNSNTSTITNGIDMTTAGAATEVSLQTDYWSTEQNLFSNPTTGMSSSTSSSSSPMVTPKPVTTNPSPVLTLITTPIETPTASYFSPHVTNNDSPSMLSAQKGFELTKDNNLRELISDNFYSAIDFQDTVI